MLPAQRQGVGKGLTFRARRFRVVAGGARLLTLYVSNLAQNRRGSWVDRYLVAPLEHAFVAGCTDNLLDDGGWERHR